MRRKAENINQKVPTSNIMPKKDIFDALENIAEIKNASTIPRPATKSRDFGRTIFPSENLAAAQKIMEIVRPTTSKSPLEVSMGIFTKGKKKIGNNTTTKKSDQKEILSKMFDNILFLKLNYYINKSTLNINYFFYILSFWN